MANNEITDASNLFISIDNELRPWSDVSQDIISYLKTKVEGLSQSLIYKGSVTSLAALEAIQDKSVGDMYNVTGDNNANYAWNGYEWDSLGPMSIIIDTEATEGSTNAIQSGFVYRALMNYAEYTDVQAIINEVFGSTDVQAFTRNISQELADIENDISDIQNDLNNIPDPLISLDSPNGLVYSNNDGGLFVTDNSTAISQLQNTVSTLNASVSEINSLIGNIQNNTTSEISEINIAQDTTVNIGIDSDNIMYYQVSGDVTFNFTPSTTATDFSKKYLYIKAADDVNLAVTGGEWSMIQEDPTFYEAGYCLFVRVIWIDCRVILETIDANQMPDALVEETNP